MSCIVVSGLVNVETTLNIGQFPVEYTPIEYKFFGLKSNVAGVAYNVAKALVTLENNVELLSMLGKDGESKVVLEGIQNANIQDKYILSKLNETPTSLILFDTEGKRKIYCDLKDIQETDYPMDNAKEAIEMAMYTPKVIVLGRGSKGALMYLGEKDEFVELAAVKTNEIVNTVGAGDALFSAFIHFYAKGMEASECLKRAQIFASLKIAYNGASLGFASEEEIEGWYKKIYV